MHFFISPHPDDAVLSCGGMIDALVQAGERVEVLTLFAADFPSDLPPNPFIQAIHARWGLGDNPMVGRRQEDQQALARLGVAQLHFGDWLDCIYRQGVDGSLLYAGDDLIFGEIHPDDPILTKTLDLERYSTEISHLYIPLGAGRHVDHRLASKLALRWLEKAPQVAFFLYEEYPYSSEAGEVLHAHSGQALRLGGSSAIQAARRELPFETISRLWPLSKTAIEAKIDAIACYQSQMSSFWHSWDDMSVSVWASTRQDGQTSGVTYGERLWTLDKPGEKN